MKRLFLIALALFVSVCVFSEDDGSSEKTSVVNGRFEIIQKHAMRLTFKLDKYTGDVYYLEEPYSHISGNYHWKKAVWIGSDYESNQDKDKINYQLFISAIAARYTILTNINTGKSWIMYEDSNEGFFFSPIYDF